MNYVSFRSIAWNLGEFKCSEKFLKCSECQETQKRAEPGILRFDLRSNERRSYILAAGISPHFVIRFAICGVIEEINCIKQLICIIDLTSQEMHCGYQDIHLTRRW